jgi:hypothetical protein
LLSRKSRSSIKAKFSTKAGSCGNGFSCDTNHLNKGGIMFRIGIVCCVWLLGVFDGAIFNGALAETPAERGDYLVNTIMACGNCHSPRDVNGKTITEKAFSGGLTFNTPAFVATAPNITPDVDTGIGSWSDAEIKRALVEGMRPDHGRSPA